MKYFILLILSVASIWGSSEDVNPNNKRAYNRNLEVPLKKQKTELNERDREISLAHPQRFYAVASEDYYAKYREIMAQRQPLENFAEFQKL